MVRAEARELSRLCAVYADHRRREWNVYGGSWDRVPSIWEPPMLDVVFIALTIVLFLIGAGYAVLCDRL
jgi:hypothetical protein